MQSSNLNTEENSSEKAEDKQAVDGAETSNLQSIVETKYIVIPDSDINSNLTSSSGIMMKEFEENSSFSNDKDLSYENYFANRSRDKNKTTSPDKYEMNVFKNENLNTKAVVSTNMQTIHKENLENLCKEDVNNNQVATNKQDEPSSNEELSEDSDTSSEYSFSNPTESFLQPIDTHQMTQEFIEFIQELDNYYRKNPSKANLCQV